MSPMSPVGHLVVSTPCRSVLVHRGKRAGGKACMAGAVSQAVLQSPFGESPPRLPNCSSFGRAWGERACLPLGRVGGAGA